MASVWYSVATCFASSSLRVTPCRPSKYACPASVRQTRRVLRWSSRTPRRRSRSETCELTVAREIPRSSAAAEKLSSAATVRNVLMPARGSTDFIAVKPESSCFVSAPGAGFPNGTQTPLRNS